MLKRYLSALLSICLIVSLAACGASGGSSAPSASSASTAASTSEVSDPFADGPTYTLKLGHVQSTTHPYNIGAEAFASKLNELTGGKVTVNIFPGSQLGGEIDMIESCQMGNLDFVVAGTSNLTNFDPTFTAFDFPFLFQNREHAYAVLDGEFGQTKLEKLKESGLIAFHYWENGFFDIMNGKKEITKIEEMRGLNIRTMQNPVYLAAFAAMGANPVPMPPAEVYTALQNGTVDGNCLSINGIYGFKFYEVQSTYMIADMFFCALPLVMSKTLYDNMPEAYQHAVTEASQYAMEIERQATVDQEATNLAAMVESGITVTNPENRGDWVKLMEEQVYPQFAKQVNQEDIDTIRSYAK